MKKNIIKTSALCALALLSAGCEDAKYQVLDNMVYISDAYESKTKDITMADSGNSKTAITVRMAQVAQQDVTIGLSVDAAYLEQYNAINQTDYKIIEVVDFEKSVTIPAGKTSSEPIVIDIPYFETNGASYSLPIVISSVSGGIALADNSSRLLINLVKPIKQMVPKFTYNNGMKANPQEAWGLSLPNYTVEWWSRMTGKYGDDAGYSKNNQAIINSGSSSTEMYIRFGDLVYADATGYKNNFLQIKTMGDMQIDSGDPTKGLGLTSGVWYHFAISYDAASGKCTLYKNGIESGTASGAPGRPMLIDQFCMISSGAQYFPDYCEVCQVRLWKTTRSDVQIQKGMYSEVAYDDENLVFYLPMSEKARVVKYSDGTESAEIDPSKTISEITLTDVTGNGHDMTIGNLESGYTCSNVTWAEYKFAR